MPQRIHSITVDIDRSRDKNDQGKFSNLRRLNTHPKYPNPPGGPIQIRSRARQNSN